MKTATKTHAQPIYFVELKPTNAGTLLVTNTESDSGQTGPDGFPVQYRQTVNLSTGACTCGCQGFQESIAWKAQKEGVTPTIYNKRTCKHIKKATESGREWGYIDQPAPKVEAPVFDYVSFFED